MKFRLFSRTNLAKGFLAFIYGDSQSSRPDFYSIHYSVIPLIELNSLCLNQDIYREIIGFPTQNEKPNTEVSDSVDLALLPVGPNKISRFRRKVLFRNL